jgi:hypothetical protein
MNKKQSFEQPKWKYKWYKFSLFLRAERGGKCELCGAEQKRNNLIVHHIEGDTDNYSDLTDLSKFQVLCRHCHSLIHLRDFNMRDKIREGVIEAQRGIIKSRWINNGVIELKLNPGENIPEGFSFGRLPIKEETREKMRIANKKIADNKKLKGISFSHGTTESAKKAWETRRKNGTDKFNSDQKELILKKRYEKLPYKYVDLLTEKQFKTLDEIDRLYSKRVVVYSSKNQPLKWWKGEDLVCLISERDKIIIPTTEKMKIYKTNKKTLFIE